MVTPMIENNKKIILLGTIIFIFIIFIHQTMCESNENKHITIWEVRPVSEKGLYKTGLNPIGIYENGKFRSFIGNKLIEGDGYIEMNQKANRFLKKGEILSLLDSGMNVGKIKIDKLATGYHSSEAIVYYENKKILQENASMLALSDTTIKGNTYQLKTEQVDLFKKKIMNESKIIFRRNRINENLIINRKITYFEAIRENDVEIVISIVSIANDSLMCQDCSKIFLILEKKQDRDIEVAYKSFKKGVVRAPRLSIIGHFDVNNDGFDVIVISHGLAWGMYYEILSRDDKTWESVYRSPEFDIQ
jgi:hypothetical protein